MLGRYPQTAVPLVIIAIVVLAMSVSLSRGDEVHPAYILIAGGSAAVIWFVMAAVFRFNEVGTAAGSLVVLSAVAGAFGAFIAALAGMLGALLLAYLALLPRKPRPPHNESY